VVLGRAGDPGDRDALVGQELGCGLLDVWHGSSPRLAFLPPAGTAGGLGPTVS
jgi:hypothetical protein